MPHRANINLHNSRTEDRLFLSDKDFDLRRTAAEMPWLVRLQIQFLPHETTTLVPICDLQKQEGDSCVTLTCFRVIQLPNAISKQEARSIV